MIRLIVCMGICIAAPLGSLFANPNNQDPHASLDVHGLCDGAKELASQLEAAWKSVTVDVEKQRAIRKDKQYEKLAPKVIQNLYVVGSQMKRMANKLSEMCEPAGKDFGLRADYVVQFAAVCGQDYITQTRAGQTLNQRTRTQLDKERPNRQKLALRIRDTMQQGNLEAAERELDKAYDDLNRLLVFMKTQEQGSYVQVFTPCIPIYSKRSQERKAASAERLASILQSQAPNTDELIQLINQAAESIKTTGTCQLGTTTATGPVAFVKFFQQWQLRHVKIVRSQGLSWALASLSKPSSTNWRKEADDLAEKSIAALQQIILADATRMAGQDATELYNQYVAAIAPLMQTTVNPELYKATEESLAKLSATTPKLNDATTQYKQATDEVLHWRRLLSATLSKRTEAKFPKIASQFVKASRSGDDYIGLYNESDQNQIKATLRAPAPHVLPTAVEKLMDQPTQVSNLQRLPGGGRFTMAMYDLRNYANVPAGFSMTAKIDSLAEDLLVSESQPALSLRAAAALASAKNNDMVAIGGTIKGMHMEGVVSRIASLPNAAFVLLPIKRLAGDNDNQAMALNQVMMRFDVVPIWVQHEYFFGKIPTPAQ